MTTVGIDGGLAEDWVCSHAHVASGVRMQEGSGAKNTPFPVARRDIATSQT